MMFLKAQLGFLCLFIYCASCMPINYKNKSTKYNEKKRPVNGEGEKDGFQLTIQTTEESKLNVIDNKPTTMLNKYKTITNQRHTFFTESPNTLKEFSNVWDRDVEFMRRVFDIVDDQVFDNNENFNLLKKIQKRHQLQQRKEEIHQLQHRKEEIRKSVVKEVAKKIFPSCLQNEMHLAENLIKLSPDQIFKTALHWGIIRSNTNSENTYKINDAFDTYNEALSTRDLLIREDQRFRLPSFMTSLDNDEKDFWIHRESAKEAIRGDATKSSIINSFSGYDRPIIYELKNDSTKANEITLMRTSFKSSIHF